MGRPCSLAAAVAVAAVLVFGGGAAAGAATAPGQPLAVSAATLTQQGQDLVWTVTVAQTFSPAHLARDHRTLCLLVEHRSGAAIGELCVAGPARGTTAPRVSYAPIAHGVAGSAQILAAAIVTRGSPRELTASFIPTDVGLPYTALGWQVSTTASAAACPPGTGTPPTCSLRFPATVQVAALHVPKLVGCVATGPTFVTHGPTNERVVALTFDDGPWYDTAQFLDILEHEHVNATFFEIGDQIATYGEGGAIERRMLADGDMIGDHTWSHPDVAGAGAFAAGQIRRAAAAIKAVTGFEPCLFRAPYGAVSPALLAEARSLGFTTIQWNVDPRDWALPGVSAIEQNVIANARSGSIIIQHDGGGNRAETMAALPVEIATLRREGYRFETITQMLGYRLIYK